MTERIAVIQGIRTPFCKANGVFNDWDADDLGAFAVKELLMRTAIDPKSIGEVIMGNVVNPSHAMNLGRVIAVKAGIPVQVPASTVSRNCASGIEAIVLGMKSIQLKDAEIVIVGGAESMSQYPIFFKKKMKDWFIRFSKAKSFGEKLKLILSLRPSYFAPVIPQIADPLCSLTMGQTAEILAREYHVSREEQDLFAMESQKRAYKAIEDGVFLEEIIPVPGKAGIQTKDDGPRSNQSLEALAKLPTAFDRLTGTVTAGSSSQVTDGAAALLLMCESKAKALGLKPQGYLSAYAYIGLDPSRMGLGPAYAISKILDQTKRKLSDFDLIEVNEAFAAQVLAVEKALASQEFAKKELNRSEAVGLWDRSKLNVNGGAIALGHPLGASGTRLVITLLRELRKRGKKLGLASLCIGGGQGEALIVEAE